MTKTIPADYIGSASLGYTLLALPSENMKTQIRNLLEKLSQAWPAVLWPMPLEQLHITLCEIIQPKAYAQDKEALFMAHEDDYRNVPAEILSNIPKFTVTFDIIEASPQAIIVRAGNSDMFNSIRAALVANMQLPDGTRTPPDITHSSIARYLTAIELGKVQEVIDRHKIAIEEEISEFKLLRNEVPPLQKYELLETYPLAHC